MEGMEKKLRGSCLLKICERDFKPKFCNVCGKKFKPTYPRESYCSDECRKTKEKVMLQEKRKKSSRYNLKKYYDRRPLKFCELCGEPIDDHRQKVHFECAVEQVRSGNLSKSWKRYFMNRGYSMAEVKEMQNNFIH